MTDERDPDAWKMTREQALGFFLAYDKQSLNGVGRCEVRRVPGKFEVAIGYPDIAVNNPVHSHAQAVIEVTFDDQRTLVYVARTVDANGKAREWDSGSAESISNTIIDVGQWVGLVNHPRVLTP